MKEYRSRLTAPLNFHNFNRYFAIPLGMIVTIGQFISEFGVNGYTETGPFSWLYTMDAIFYTALFILLMTAFIGFLSWHHSAYISFMLILSVQIIYRLFAVCLYIIYAPSMSTDPWSTAFGYLIYAILAYIYYRKRKPLFATYYSEPEEAVKETPPMEQTNIVRSPQVLFCRKCGAKLPLDSRFCKICGTELLVSATEFGNK
ncbi:MAG: zinc ribbon domain-containing protein [Bacillota bacterium]